LKIEKLIFDTLIPAIKIEILYLRVPLARAAILLVRSLEERDRKRQLGVY
jgi:hypothetical protein